MGPTNLNATTTVIPVNQSQLAAGNYTQPTRVIYPVFVPPNVLTFQLGGSYAFSTAWTGYSGIGVLENYSETFTSSSSAITIDIVGYNSVGNAQGNYNQMYQYMLNSGASYYAGNYMNQTYYVLNSTQTIRNVTYTVYIGVVSDNNYLITMYGEEIGNIFNLQQFVNVVKDEIAATYGYF